MERRLAYLAIRKGYITLDQLNEAVSVRRSTDPAAPIDVVLVSLGYLGQEAADRLVRVVQSEGAPAAVPRELIAPPAGAPAQPEEPEIQIVGPCTIMEPIGRGPSGTVYRAFHGDLGREVALKMVPKNSLNAPFIEKFGERARRVCGLTHPNIAEVLEVVDRPEGLYIASELVEGTTLLDHVRRDGPLDVGRAIAVLRQIGSALQAAHRTGAVHGNLKAENVFLAGDLDVKLTDFGLARDDPAFLRAHADLAGGILHVMPPEQWRRAAVPASDFYACGVLWHYMLTGTFPFTGKGYMVTRQNHERGIASMPTECRSDLPAGADVLFRSLAHKSARKRYLHVRDLLADLRTLEIGLTPKGPRPRPAPAAGRVRSEGGQKPPLRLRSRPSGGERATSR